MRILVVEDEKEISDIIKSKLEKEKYIVDTIYDGSLCEAEITSPWGDVSKFICFCSIDSNNKKW